MSTNAITRTGKLALLSKAGLFSQLREAELRTISRYSGYRTFAEGEMIFPEGSHREELYLIKNGKVVIRRGGNGEGQDIARFVAGEVFGEMDLLDSAPRSASAFAEEPTTLLVFPDTVPFQELLAKHPYVFARILRKLVCVYQGAAAKACTAVPRWRPQSLIARVRSFRQPALSR